MCHFRAYRVAAIRSISPKFPSQNCERVSNFAPTSIDLSTTQHSSLSAAHHGFFKSCPSAVHSRPQPTDTSQDPTIDSKLYHSDSTNSRHDPPCHAEDAIMAAIQEAISLSQEVCCRPRGSSTRGIPRERSHRTREESRRRDEGAGHRKWWLEHRTGWRIRLFRYVIYIVLMALCRLYALARQALQVLTTGRFTSS